MSMSDKGVDALCKFEGTKKNDKGQHIAYKCSAGVWTCGYGATQGVTPTTVWSEDTARARLCQDLIYFENVIRKLVTAPLNEHQHDALMCFVYNLGEANLKKSTLLRLLNARDYEGAGAQFPRWDWVNGKPNEGVRRRRLAEQAMFLTGRYPEVW